MHSQPVLRPDDQLRQLLAGAALGHASDVEMRPVVLLVKRHRKQAAVIAAFATGQC